MPSECDAARGLFVTSEIVGGSGAGTLVPVVARRGEADPALLLAWCRTGVKPVRIFWSAFRKRGVVGCWGRWPAAACPSGALSAVKVCGGREAQSSKSSGARRLTPMRDDEDEDDEEKRAALAELGLEMGMGIEVGGPSPTDL